MHRAGARALHFSDLIIYRHRAITFAQVNCVLAEPRAKVL